MQNEAHVRPLVRRYAEARGKSTRALTDRPQHLLEFIAERGGPEALAADKASGWNAQRTSTGPAGILKAEAVRLAAELLVRHGVTTTNSLVRAAKDRPELHDDWRTLPGQGSSDAGWRYLLHLAGVEVVEPDRYVQRFVAEGLGRNVTPEHTRRVLMRTAERLGTSPQVLDHRLWRVAASQERGVPAVAEVDVPGGDTNS